MPRRAAAIEAVARHARRRLRDRRATKRSDWRVGRAGGPSAASRRRASGDSGRRLSDRRDTERSEWRGGRVGPLAESSGVGRNRRTLFRGLAQRPRGSGTPLPLDERRFWIGGPAAATVATTRTTASSSRDQQVIWLLSTHCSRSDLKEAVARGLTGRPGDMACLCRLLSSLAPATAVPFSVDCWLTGSCLRTPIFQAHDRMGARRVDDMSQANVALTLRIN